MRFLRQNRRYLIRAVEEPPPVGGQVGAGEEGESFRSRAASVERKFALIFRKLFAQNRPKLHQCPIPTPAP